MSEQLIRDIGAEVKSALATLAEQVGAGVDHFWPLFVQQQVIEGYYSLALVASFVACACVGGYWVLKVDCPEAKGFIFALGVMVPLMICSAVAGDSKKIFNPEYYAVKEVMRLVK